MYKNCPISECWRRNACSRYMDFRNTHENRKKNEDWKIRRKEWSKCERKKRERERKRDKHWADRSTGIRAPRALLGEDVQRLCPRARRVRVTGTFPSASHPRGLLCFILVYHPVTRSLPRCLPRLAFFLTFGFNRNVTSVVRRARRRKSA